MKPSCVELITKLPQVHVRITLDFIRGRILSKLIEIYMKFDRRALELIQLVRIFVKVCSIFFFLNQMKTFFFSIEDL